MSFFGNASDYSGWAARQMVERGRRDERRQVEQEANAELDSIRTGLSRTFSASTAFTRRQLDAARIEEIAQMVYAAVLATALREGEQ